MKVVRFSDLGENVREAMQGARWILLEQDELQHALSALMFAELDGALVAIDGRGVNLNLEADVQRRAVHLLVVDDVIEAARIQKTAGITKVIAGHQGPIEDLLW